MSWIGTMGHLAWTLIAVALLTLWVIVLMLIWVFTGGSGASFTVGQDDFPAQTPASPSGQAARQELGTRAVPSLDQTPSQGRAM